MKQGKGIQQKLLGAVSALALTLACSAGMAEEAVYTFNIDAQPLEEALIAFSQQSNLVVMAPGELTAGKTAPALRGEMDADDALEKLLEGSGLKPTEDPSGAYMITVGLADTSSNEVVRPVRVAQADTQEEGAVETASDEDREDERDRLKWDEIVVTGSLIRGIAPESSPLIQFDREDIEESGYSTLGDFIQRSLPQNFSAGASQDSLGAGFRGGADLNAGDGTGVNLRGLGNDSTLVLINGRRVAPSGSGSFVDISMIPASAVDRVDVLTDGASATYGSDAVGGVVNFILRDDYEGAETRLNYGSFTDGDGDVFQAGQTFGKSWNTGHAVVIYDYYQRDPLDSTDRANTIDTLDPTDILPGQERHSVLFSGAQELNEDVELFLDAIYSNRDADSRAVNTLSLIPFASNRDNDQINISFGTNVDLSHAWRLALFGTFSQNDVTSISTNTNTGMTSSTNNETLENWIVDAKADGNLLDLPGGAVKAAIGGQYRTEEFTSELISTGFPTFGANLDRDVYAVFGELYVPIIGEDNRFPGIARLEVSAAIRFEDYSDFGDSTDPKFGILWSPVGGLNFRGTWSTSFRAPLLTELDDSLIAAAVINFLDTSVPAGSSFGASFLGNNPSLGPEDATTWTVGADFAPDSVPGLNLSLTYFNIDFADRIAAPIPATVVFGDIGDPFNAPFVDRTPDIAFILDGIARATANNQFFDFSGGMDPSLSSVFVDVRLQNLAATKVDGIDFYASYELDSEIGVWNFDVNGSYILNFDEQVAPTAPVSELVDTVFNPVDLRLRGGLGWSDNGLGANVFVNYVDSYTDNLATPNEKIEAWITVDLRLNMNIGEVFGNETLEGANVSLSFLNLFDNLPPFIDNSGVGNFNVGFDQENHDINGRSFLISVRHAW